MLLKTKKEKITSKLDEETDPFYNQANQSLLRKNAKEMEETGGTIHDINQDV